MPVYNVEPHLRECLDSIVNQVLDDIEIVCINDGSTDNSLSILEEYRQVDGRITIISQENRGLSASRNVGMDIARGDYIHFMDSDDILREDALGKLFSLAKKNSLDVVYFDATVFFDSEELKKSHGVFGSSYSYIREHTYRGVMTGKSMFVQMSENKEYRPSMCMQLINRNFLNKNNLRFYEGIYHEDQPFNFLCMMKAQKVSHLGEPFFKRRIRSGSIVTTEKGYKHFYGYFISYTHILKYAFISNISGDVAAQTIRLLENIRNNLVWMHKESADWFNSMSEVEQYIFEYIAAKPAKLMSAESEIQNLRDQIETLNTQIAEIYTSKSWKLGNKLAGIYRKIFRK